MTTKSYIILATAFCALIQTNIIAAESVRTVENINREWKYAKGDIPNAYQIDYSDLNWDNIGLPHSFSIPYFLSPDFYVGYGWYRKHIVLTKNDLSKSLFLEFEGVFQEAEIFVNGVKAGSHRGGYTGFSIDISKYVQAGDNVIAIRVNNEWKADLAPRGGEHVFSGGIYRNVKLVKKNPIHIDWCGNFITTPTLKSNEGKSSTVNVKSDVINTTNHTSIVKLEISIFDSSSKVVAKTAKEAKLSANSQITLDLSTEEVTQPVLWSPSNPNIYTAVCKLYEGSNLVDEEAVKFGFRYFEWSADKGFFLNGEHYFFHGANVHQDQAGWGDAVTESASRRDVQMVKDAGLDMIRGSHYPHSPAFAEACDEIGILFWSEAPFWATAGTKKDGSWTASGYPVRDEDIAGFEASALTQLEEMIKINRNHPSIFVWSMCNEPFFSDTKAIPGMKSLLKKMVDKAHQLDPTRVAAIGGAQRPLGRDRIDLIGDVAGYNGDGANIEDFQNPGIPSVVTEYGSTTADRPGEYIPGWGDLARNDGWRGLEWRSGQSLWCAFDHGSLFGNDMAKMGFIDYFRLPKRQWYWYRNQYKGIPAPIWPMEGNPAILKLNASKTKNICTDGTDDVQLTITVCDNNGKHISNNPDVELVIVSGPGEFPTGRRIKFSNNTDINILDGQAAIAIRSYYAGKTVIEARSNGLETARIELDFIGKYRFKEGKSKINEERKYVRYIKGEDSGFQDFGLNNPAFSSPSVIGHSAGMAVDGDKSTFWQPLKQIGEKNTYITLDTERTVVMNTALLVFITPFKGEFQLETSLDNISWKRLGYKINKTDSSIKTTFDTAVEARYLRVTFSSDNEVKLAEISVSGLLSK
jgi:beta-galactosidase